MHESEAPYRALFEHARDAILLTDDSGRYVDANPAACALLGYTRQELRMLTVWDVTAPETADQSRALWRKFTSGGHSSGECVMVRRDGTRVAVEFNSVANVLPGLHLTINSRPDRASARRRAVARIRAEIPLDSRQRAARALHDRSHGPFHVVRGAGAGVRGTPERYRRPVSVGVVRPPGGPRTVGPREHRARGAHAGAAGRKRQRRTGIERPISREQLHPPANVRRSDRWCHGRRVRCDGPAALGRCAASQ